MSSIPGQNSVQMDNLAKQISDHRNSPYRQMSAHVCISSGESARTNQVDKSEEQIPVQETGKPLALYRQRPILRTEQQWKVAAFIDRHEQISGHSRVIAKEIGVPYATLRRILRDLRQTELIRYGELPRRTGIWVQALPRLRLVLEGTSMSLCNSSRHTAQTIQADQAASRLDRLNTSHSSIREQTDRTNLDLVSHSKLKYLSATDIALQWPNLARSGFGVSQIEQILECLIKAGKPTDDIAQGLDHLEWALEHGCLLDSKGEPIRSPCDWAFRCLARQGYYSRPQGYVSPAEQAERDRVDAANAVRRAREEAEMAEFASWLSNLSQADRAQIIRPKRGPDDVQLRMYWRKHMNTTASNEACFG